MTLTHHYLRPGLGLSLGSLDSGGSWVGGPGGRRTPAPSRRWVWPGWMVSHRGNVVTGRLGARTGGGASGSGPWVLPPGHLRLRPGQGWTCPQGPNGRRMGLCRVERSGCHPACAPSPSGQTESADAHKGTWQEVTFARVSVWPRSQEEPPPLAPLEAERGGPPEAGRKGPPPEAGRGRPSSLQLSPLWLHCWGGGGVEGVGVRMCPRERASLGGPHTSFQGRAWPAWRRRS